MKVSTAKLFSVTTKCMFEMLKELSDDIPDDAECLSVHIDYNYDTIVFKVWHFNKFNDVPEGGCLEKRDITFEVKELLSKKKEESDGRSLDI